MCRHYVIFHTCGHFTHDARICSLSNNCNSLSRNNTISIPSYCKNCIGAPTFPTISQQSPNIPGSGELAHASNLWAGFHRLYFGERVANNERPDPLTLLPPADLDLLHNWLLLLQASRPTPSSWAKTFPEDYWDKVIMLQLLRIITFNSIEARESELNALQGSLKPNLLTKIEIENLEEEDRSCVICLEDYGKEDVVVKLPCGHSFGEVCIKIHFGELGWKCPLCRRVFERSEWMLKSSKVVTSPWWIEWLEMFQG